MTRTHPRVWLSAAIAAAAMGWMVGPAIARQDSHDAARESWQRVPDIFTALGVRPGAVVADVGAGPGFFTERLARAVGPDGRVFAVDVDGSAVRRLRDRMQSSGLTNVEAVQGDARDPKLPDASLDAALIVNAYHEMVEHQSMLAAIRAALKPTGRLVIVEPISDARKDDSREAQTQRHQIASRFVTEDARAAGFRVVSLEEPFAQRPGRDYEYLLVLEPDAPSAGGR